MKPSDLHTLWSAPDNTRLTAKQQSFRLPVHVAAKLAALCDLYPGKTRTQIVGDLLSAALESSLEGLPSVKGKMIDRIEDDEHVVIEVFVDVGPSGKFKHLANRYYAELERELGNAEPADLYQYNYVRKTADEDIREFTVAE